MSQHKILPLTVQETIYNLHNTRIRKLRHLYQRFLWILEMTENF